MKTTEFMKLLDGAKLVLMDRDRDYLLAWYGNSAVYAYNTRGMTIAYWNIEFPEGLTFEERLKMVEENMVEHMAEGNYPV